MSNQPRCQQITRRGRPCRNPALPHSDPPRCARHRAQPDRDDAQSTQLRLFDLPPVKSVESRPNRPAPHPKQPAVGEPAAIQPYLRGLSPTELDELELNGLSPDLHREVQAVRVVMLRLLRLWNDPTEPVVAEEARRLAALVFSGARTVAHLLSRPVKDTDTMDWFAQALKAMGDNHGLDL